MTTAGAAQFRSLVGFVQAETVGNLSVGSGRIADLSPCIALVENRSASGALGSAECRRLAALYRTATAANAPLVLYLDSAGARVSEGLPALGAFRQLYRAALAAHAAGLVATAVLGTHCFGGASMLGALCGRRYFGAATQLAMSGPSILATAAGGSALDDMFRAIVAATIGATARIKLPGNAMMENAIALDAPPALKPHHQELCERLGATRPATAEKVQRKDLNHLYPQGYQLEDRDGVVTGDAVYEGAAVVLLGAIDRRLLTARRAWLLAEAALRLTETPPASLHLLIDCEGHSTHLDDEKPMLSAYLAHLAVALRALAARGCRVIVIVLGTLGGGAYVALAAAADEVCLLHGAHIQLLPSKAIAAILGDATDGTPAFADYRAAGVADRELKVGYLRS